MKRFAWLAGLLILLPVLAAAQGVPIKDGDSPVLAEVNEHGSVQIITGKSSTATYTVSVSNVAATAANTAVISLESEGARGFRITQFCIHPGSATAAAHVQWQLIRTTTASSGGTSITQEATTGNNGLAKMDPSDPNWTGAARTGGTAGTSGAILDGGNAFVMITATPPAAGATSWCKNYGTTGEKLPRVLAGTTNGVKFVWEGTAGGADFGASITFIAD